LFEEGVGYAFAFGAVAGGHRIDDARFCVLFIIVDEAGEWVCEFIL
jgi:hypothetical protein